MSIFTISDLHLSFGADKPMNIFRGWDNYTQRISDNWNRLVTPDDTVVIPGDLSWSMKLEDTAADFAFLNALPGRKIIIKGNHDLWWSTSAKMRAFLIRKNFSTVDFVFNSAVCVGDYAVCGTRGWFYDDTTPDAKILMREAGRLRSSITAAEATGLTPLVFLHYPPVFKNQVCNEIFSVLKEKGIKTVYHGHIHGAGKCGAVHEYDGISLKLVSCDCVDFTPQRIVL